MNYKSKRGQFEKVKWCKIMNVGIPQNPQLFYPKDRTSILQSLNQEKAAIESQIKQLEKEDEMLAEQYFALLQEMHEKLAEITKE